MDWKEFERLVFKELLNRSPDEIVTRNIKVVGRHSNVPRQIDVLIGDINLGIENCGVIEAKKCSKKVNVKTVDSLIGFLLDIGAAYGGIYSSKGFSKGAINRAKNSGIDLRLINSDDPVVVAEIMLPMLDFRDPDNSMYLAMI
jgi:predicted Mrr-cat superfamily restriction endonuclease